MSGTMCVPWRQGQLILKQCLQTSSYPGGGRRGGSEQRRESIGRVQTLIISAPQIKTTRSNSPGSTSTQTIASSFADTCQTVTLSELTIRQQNGAKQAAFSNDADEAILLFGVWPLDDNTLVTSHRKTVESGFKTWKVIGQTSCQSHSSRPVRFATTTLAVSLQLEAPYGYKQHRQLAAIGSSVSLNTSCQSQWGSKVKTSKVVKSLLFFLFYGKMPVS